MVNITRTLVGIQNPMCVESIQVFILSDSLVEADETFNISLSSNSFIVTIDNPNLQFTIESDDSKLSLLLSLGPG